jgi:hypothetical protein
MPSTGFLEKLLGHYRSNLFHFLRGKTAAQAIGKIIGNVIYNYYYREESQTSSDDTAASASDDPLLCPYRGLFHFGPGDAEYFFGQENFVEELVRATQSRNFIPLLGALGSGKSSVDFAYNLGCKAIQLAGIPQHLTPVLKQKNAVLQLIRRRIGASDTIP